MIGGIIMSERINTPFTNEHFADWCLKMAAKKSPYWYGTCVYKASTSVLNSKTRQYSRRVTMQDLHTAIG